MKDTRIELCAHDNCTGCFACAAKCPKHAIGQYVDEEGFRYPVIESDNCVACHLCEKTCPIMYPVSKYDKGITYAAWSLNPEIRLRSSSGGLFSEIALSIINEGGIVVGASMNKSGYVVHTIADNESKLSELRGSKYVQSTVDATLYDIMQGYMKEHKKVLFSGTPCQVAAARSFFKDSEYLFTIDIVCHGVPSPEVFASVFKAVRKKYPNLVSYNFRQLDSWGVCGSVNVNVNVNGKLQNIPLYGDYTFYQDAFSKGLMHRMCCYDCKFTSIERVGDITLGDFWGIGKYAPKPDNYQFGCSLVSVNSKQGRQIFSAISNNIYFEERDINETIDGGNAQLVSPSRKPFGRKTFYGDFNSFGVKNIIKKYELKTISKPRPIYIRLAIRLIKKICNI